jgi:hypothetical protein
MKNTKEQLEDLLEECTERGQLNEAWFMPKALALIRRKESEARIDEFRLLMKAGKKFRRIMLDGVENSRPFDLYIKAEDYDRYQRGRIETLKQEEK